MFLLLVLVCGLLLALFIVYRFAYAPYQVLKRCGIKGPAPVPFFGNYKQESKMTILKFYEHLHQEYGSVAGFYIGQKPHILIADLDMLKQIMVKDFNNFIDHEDVVGILPKGPKGLLFTHGEAWRTSRQILTPTFSSSKMKMMTPLIKESADFLVEIFGEKAKSGESFEFFKTYGAFTMETILATAFGRVVNVQRGESDDLTKAAHDRFRALEEGRSTSLETAMVFTSNFPWMLPFCRFLFAHSEQGQAYFQLQSIALELVKARRDGGKKFKDMLQLMIDATGEDREEDGESKDMDAQASKNKGKLTDKEVVAQAVGMLMAGYETTANALAYTSYLLALNPDIQEKLQSEIDSYFDDKPDAPVYDACQDITYLENMILESLRLYPPAPRTNRVCLKTTVVKGVTIPKGCTVVIPSFLLHKSQLYWKDPEKFDPDRFKAEERAKRPQLAHLPFGFGPRSCIGMRFALLEAKVALIELLKRYTFVRAPDTEVPLQTVLGVTMAPKNGVYLKVINRVNC